jgi:polysaccharide biosynthesis/export protein
MQRGLYVRLTNDYIRLQPVRSVRSHGRAVKHWIHTLNSLQQFQFAIAAVCIVASGVAGCSTVPTAGPTVSEVMDQAAKEPRNFDLVEIDGRVVAALASQPEPGLHNRIESYGKPPRPTIGIGDTIAVSIWQAPNGQVFAAPNAPGAAGAGGGGGGNVAIPDQVVDADGSISVPYAGRVPAAGRTALQVQQTIEQRLTEQTVQPQVIVTVTKAVHNSVTVLGEEGTAARVPLSTAGDRLLDVIAAAGGSKLPLYNTSVRLTRDGQITTIPVTALLSDPAQDIYVWPGDVIALVQTPEKFSVFGATTNNTQVPFDAERLDLAQAIAKAGGLMDLRADPEGVFLLRFEPPAVVSALGVPDLANRPGGESPILYHLNLRQIGGYYLAERIAMANNDLIYVANAKLTELEKFFTAIGAITGPVITGTVAGVGVNAAVNPNAAVVH